MLKKILGLAMLAAITSSIATQGIAASPGANDDFKKNVGNYVYFDYDSTGLNPKTTQVLDKAAAWLKSHPEAKVIIEGHTDERGTRAYNLTLGGRRAAAVADYLVAAGIATDRISEVSFGEDQPAVLGSDELNWLFNRRAVMIID